MRTTFFILFLIILTSCTKYPYEQEIQKFYRDNARVGVGIKEVTIDSAVTAEQARPHLESRFEKIKARLKNSYQETYEKAKSGRKAQDIVLRAKERLDSANNGLFSDDEFEIKNFKELLSQKQRYEQITVRFKFPGDYGERTQVFVSRVSEKDTVLQMTDKDLKDYLTH